MSNSNMKYIPVKLEELNTNPSVDLCISKIACWNIFAAMKWITRVEFIRTCDKKERITMQV